MLPFLLHRPIAVLMTLIAMLAISALAFFHLPVSLLPDIDVPEIAVSIRYPDGSPEEIERTVLQTARENLLTLNGLTTIESTAQNETGRISLRFHYGTNMSLAYIDVNEKIDRLSDVLPGAIQRPTVIKINASDIPIARIQIVPNRHSEMVMTSRLAINTLKRRLEQLDGIGLVEVSGIRQNIIRIAPDYPILKSLGLAESDIIRTIRDADLDLGALSVRDGNYRYFVRLASRISSPGEFGKLPVQLPANAGIVALEQVASVSYEEEKPLGFHLFNNREGVVLAVHKQAASRLPEVMPRLYKAIDQFRTEYTAIDFEITQDQSRLLSFSIQNLVQALFWGGLFAFGVLFLFMGNWREPLIMGTVLPVSVLLSFSILYQFDISLNVISLSGLALGLGMLVDNSIVIIDSIILKRKEGLDLVEGCIQGTREVFVPLISATLTNLVVFVPLVFMSGITGALFFDQAIAVAAILFASLGGAFVLVPLLYMLLLKNRTAPLSRESLFLRKIKRAYHASFLFLWKNKRISLTVMSLLIPAALLLLFALPKSGFPDIERTESIISIEWNEPIDAEENFNRVSDFLGQNAALILQSEAEVGQHQFLFGDADHGPQHALLYLKFSDAAAKVRGDSLLGRRLRSTYPTATIELDNAPNAFEQLFVGSGPYYEARFRDPAAKKPMSEENANVIRQELDTALFRTGRGFETETMVLLRVDFMKLKQYKVSYNELLQKLSIIFGEYRVTDFKNTGEVIPIALGYRREDFNSALQKTEVRSETGHSYPLQQFVDLRYGRGYRKIMADASGIFQSVEADAVHNETHARKLFLDMANSLNLRVDFTGRRFEEIENLQRLSLILAVSVMLMYLILTAEFESFSQPLLVMASLPLGLGGALLLLWLAGGTINVMSGIGLVVVLGVIDNDAILKIDRINRLRKKMPLAMAIPRAGTDRFRPIMMTTATTVLAVIPILFSGGLGADLQRPVAITTIGGLVVGTLATLYFVPLLYWMFYCPTNEGGGTPSQQMADPRFEEPN